MDNIEDIWHSLPSHLSADGIHSDNANNFNLIIP